jgi:uncharacterized protein
MRPKHWLRSHWRKTLLLSLLTSGIAINAIAWMQARSMTHYVENTKRTDKPEKLSLTDKARIIFTGVQLTRPINRKTPQDMGLAYETHAIALPKQEQLETWFVPAQATRGIVLLFPPYGGSKQSLFAPS